MNAANRGAIILGGRFLDKADLLVQPLDRLGLVFSADFDIGGKWNRRVFDVVRHGGISNLKTELMGEVSSGEEETGLLVRRGVRARYAA